MHKQNIVDEKRQKIQELKEEKEPFSDSNSNQKDDEETKNRIKKAKDLYQSKKSNVEALNNVISNNKELGNSIASTQKQKNNNR